MLKGQAMTSAEKKVYDIILAILGDQERVNDFMRAIEGLIDERVSYRLPHKAASSVHPAPDIKK
jgi:hypothetical protein